MKLLIGLNSGMILLANFASAAFRNKLRAAKQLMVQQRRTTVLQELEQQRHQQQRTAKTTTAFLSVRGGGGGDISNSSSMPSPSPPSAASFEVEQKFPLHDRNLAEIEKRLKRLGFTRASAVEMVDWYYDTYPGYSLTTRDRWLRYREKRKVPPGGGGGSGGAVVGQWELKQRRGLSGSGGGNLGTGPATVYEETEGAGALDLAVSLLSAEGCKSTTTTPPPTASDASAETESELSSSRNFDGHRIPDLPTHNTGLVPCARIFTRRSSWKMKNDDAAVAAAPSGRFSNLVVDLDSTDYGHAVGEVEGMVRDESEVSGIRAQIQELIDELLAGTTNDRDRADGCAAAVAKGKLEYYLEKYRPGHYQKLIESGVL